MPLCLTRSPWTITAPLRLYSRWQPFPRRTRADLLITPWDSSTLKAIEKAILASELGINPQNDGRNIRLVFPQLTEERRKELAKQVKKYAEEAKVAIRNIRRDAMDSFKTQKKNGEMTEDDVKIAEKDFQKITDDWIKEIDKIADKKEKELLRDLTWLFLRLKPRRGRGQQTSPAILR